MNKKISIAIIIFCLLVGCQVKKQAKTEKVSSNTNSGGDSLIKSNTVKPSNIIVHTNVDSLGRIIDLTSYRPLTAKWTIKKVGIANDRTPGPTDYNLEAVMHFDSMTIKSIQSNYKLLSVTSNLKDTTFFKFDWLAHDYKFLDYNADEVTYKPNFFQAGSYSHGGFIINGNDILLSFYTQ